MRNRIYRLGMCTLLCFGLGSLPLQAQTLEQSKRLPKDLDRFIEEVMAQFEVPGVSVSIVKDGETLLAKGYGVKVHGESDSVDAQTLFNIASNSKAFTATLLGILVNEGKLKWNDPVIDHLPWFRMSDPYVTENMTVEDLLVHRSGLGLGAGDLLQFPPTDYSSREIAKRLRYIPLNTSFRSAYAYDNILYLVAGELVQEVTGQSWEEAIQTRIFKPLGMHHSIPNISGLLKTSNFAMPHTLVEGVLQVGKRFPDIRMGDASNAAGGISSNALDMAAWLKFQLDSGRTGDGQRILPPSAMQRQWRMVTPMPFSKPAPHLSVLEQSYFGYALGFRVQDYRSKQIITHTGGLSGAFYSRVTLLPELGLGISVLTNQGARVAFEAITHYLLDYFMEVQPEFDWLSAYIKEDQLSKARMAKIESQQAAQRDSLSKPSLELQDYVGTYRDAWYGDVIIEKVGEQLRIRFAHTPALIGNLDHWQYDSFVARWDDRSLKCDAFVSFVLDASGKIVEVKMDKFSPAVDFSRDYHDLRLYPVKE